MDQPIDTVTLNDIRLALAPDVMSPTMLEVLRSGDYERAERDELGRIVQPGERVVEFGSGIGLLAISAMKTGLVESYAAFEANPRLVPLIERNAALNGVAFDVHNAVVQPRPAADTVPFYIRRDFWASSLSPAPWGYEEEIRVPAVSFDSVRDRYRPSLLIVDIEGGEEALFTDVALTGIKKIFMEVHQNAVGRIGMKKIFDNLSARDFHYDQWHSRGGVVLFSHVLR